MCTGLCSDSGALYGGSWGHIGWLSSVCAGWVPAGIYSNWGQAPNRVHCDCVSLHRLLAVGVHGMPTPLLGCMWCPADVYGLCTQHGLSITRPTRCGLVECAMPCIYRACYICTAVPETGIHASIVTDVLCGLCTLVLGCTCTRRLVSAEVCLQQFLLWVCMASGESESEVMIMPLVSRCKFHLFPRLCHACSLRCWRECKSAAWTCHHAVRLRCFWL